jgi:hypothetical protein
MYLINKTCTLHAHPHTLRYIHSLTHHHILRKIYFTQVGIIQEAEGQVNYSVYNGTVTQNPDIGKRRKSKKEVFSYSSFFGQRGSHG